MTEQADLITENETKPQTVKYEDKSVPEPSPFMLVATFLLLLAPFTMGIHINTLGNAVPIKADIARFRGMLPRGQPATTDNLSKLIPDSWWSTGALYPVGGMVGALSSNVLAEKLGRKKSTLFYLGTNLVGVCFRLASLSSHFVVLFLGRFFDGIGSAGIMVTAVVLMFELQSAKAQKFSKPLVQITINLGITFVAILALNEVLGEKYFHIYYLPALTSGVIILVLLILPESPSWQLNSAGDEQACVASLKKMHGPRYQSYLLELKEQSEKGKQESRSLSMAECFKNKRYRGALVSVCMLNAAQQLSGINAIMAFTPTILANMGIKNVGAFSLIILGSALVGSLIFAPMVSTWKRKRSLLVGHVVMAICLIGQLITFYLKGPNEAQLFFLAFFVFIFQVGPGPLLWFLCIEVFPPEVRAAAQSIGVSANWISNALVFAIAGLDMAVLGFFAVVNVLIVIFMLFFVSETLGRTPNDILDSYEERYKKCSC